MVMFFIEWRTKQVHKTHLQNSMYKSMKLTKHTSTGFQVHAKAEPPDRGSTRHAAGCPQAHTAAGHGARHAGGMHPTAGFSFSGCKVSSRCPAHGTRQGAGMSPHSSTAMPTACVWQRPCGAQGGQRTALLPGSLGVRSSQQNPVGQRRQGRAEVQLLRNGNKCSTERPDTGQGGV